MSRRSNPSNDRRYFIGGSDARIIMGEDEVALVRLWREKRGEVEPEEGNFGAASRAARPLACSASTHRSRGSKRSAPST
jgi:predicted phage-related endonuclease